MNKFFLVKNEYNKNKSEKSKLFYSYIESNFNLVEDPKSADYILILGGDGSMLSAIQQYKDLNIPFLGISTGTIGYYLHSVEDIEGLKVFKNTEMECIDFPLLDFEVKNENNETIKQSCFADVWIERNKPQCLKYNINIFRNNQNIYSNDEIIIGDGILFSTPIGSTGYAKNIDDHILPIDLEIYQVVPISSSINKNHFKSFPLCLKESTIEVTLENSDFRESRLIYDGILSEIKNPSYLKISYSNKKVRIAFLSKNDFRKKNLSWIIN